MYILASNQLNNRESMNLNKQSRFSINLLIKLNIYIQIPDEKWATFEN